MQLTKSSTWRALEGKYFLQRINCKKKKGKEGNCRIKRFKDRSTIAIYGPYLEPKKPKECCLITILWWCLELSFRDTNGNNYTWNEEKRQWQSGKSISTHITDHWFSNFTAHNNHLEGLLNQIDEFLILGPR